MSRWSADSREATVEDLPHKVHSLLYLQGGQVKSATAEDGEWTEVVKELTGRREPRAKRFDMAVQDNGTPSSSDENGPYSPGLCARVVIQVALAPSGKD